MEDVGATMGKNPPDPPLENGGAIMEQNAPEPNLKIGNVVPDFTLTCVDGEEHNLSDFRGTKVMLCFYRFSFCPICSYSISKLMGNYKKLAWASRLKVIMVFYTDLEFLKKGLTDDDAPIPRLSETNIYPFLALADPDGSVGSIFQIKSKGFMSHGIDFGRDFRTLRRAHKSICSMFPATSWREEFKFPASASMLPSEFLINEDGVLEDVLRAEKVIESMAHDMDRIVRFLLLGAKIPSLKGPKIFRSSKTSQGASAVRTETETSKSSEKDDLDRMVTT